MPGQHKHPPFTFRAHTEADRAWLLAQVEQTGRKVNAIMADMLHEAAASPPVSTARSTARRPARRAAPVAAELARERARDQRDDECDHPPGRRQKAGTYCGSCGTGGLEPLKKGTKP